MPFAAADSVTVTVSVWAGIRIPDRNRRERCDGCQISRRLARGGAGDRWGSGQGYRNDIRARTGEVEFELILSVDVGEADDSCAGDGGRERGGSAEVDEDIACAGRGEAEVETIAGDRDQIRPHRQRFDVRDIVLRGAKIDRERAAVGRQEQFLSSYRRTSSVTF